MTAPPRIGYAEAGRIGGKLAGRGRKLDSLRWRYDCLLRYDPPPTDADLDALLGYMLRRQIETRTDRGAA